MTVVLLIVTFASLALAGALLVYVLRLTREERDRSEARAAMLAEMLAAQGTPGQTARPAVPTSQPIEPHAPIAVPAADVVRVVPPSAIPSFSNAPAPPFQTSDAVGGDVTSADAAPMFGASVTAPRERSPQWLLIPAIGVVIVGLAIGAVYLVSRPSAQAAQAAAVAQSPLELVSLKHERQGDGLVITGMVRNPHEGQTVKGLTAVAFAFDRQGGFLTSGRGALDFPELQPGDESPFSITIPQAATVGRYRVSFRTDAGIVPHIDRRADPPAAQAAVR